MRQHFADLLKNGPWLAMFVLTLILFITLSMRGSVVLYYFTYYVGRQGLLQLASTCSAPAPRSSGSSSRSGWRCASASATSSSRGLAGHGALHRGLPRSCRPARSTLMFVSEILRQFVYGFTIPLLWAMMADVADFSEWKTGRRATGIVFSAIVFALKAGLGLRRRDHRVRAVALRLRAERGADGARARRHPLHDEHLPGRHLRDLRRRASSSTRSTGGAKSRWRRAGRATQGLRRVTKETAPRVGHSVAGRPKTGAPDHHVPRVTGQPCDLRVFVVDPSVGTGCSGTRNSALSRACHEHDSCLQGLIAAG